MRLSAYPLSAIRLPKEWPESPAGFTRNGLKRYL
jgi:hypothetical protein